MSMIRFAGFNSRPIAAAAFLVFLAVVTLRGYGVPVPFVAALAPMAVAMAFWWYSATMGMLKNSPEMRWDPPKTPKLRYTARHKCLMGVLVALAASGGFVHMAVPAVPAMALMGFGFFVIILSLTWIQRGLNRERIAAESVAASPACA